MKLRSICHTVITGLLLVLLMTACRSRKGNYNTIILEPETQTAEKLNKPEPAIAKEKKIRMKYAGYLSIPPDSISNMRLYNFIDSWLNTPYLWGGTTRAGIDCSAFMQRLLADVYDIHIPRTSIQQFFTDNVEPFGSRHYLREGDLVFFTTTKEKLISHVGLYLGNRMFVNASSTYGVSIANMDNNYWKARYVASGRVIVKKKS
jgi:hypothetical protein